MEKYMKQKKIITTLTNFGSGTKSHIILALLAAAEKKGVDIAKFDFDIDHQTLYSAYCLRDSEGDPIAIQDSITGCPLVDINKDPEQILKIAKSETLLTLADLPARAIHSIFTALGERKGVEDLYNSYYDKGIMATHIIPVIDGDKSLKTLEAIYSAINAADIDEDAKVELIVVKNIGFMDATGGTNFTNAALEAYNKSSVIDAIKNNEKFIFKEVEFNAQLNTNAKNAIAPQNDEDNHVVKKLLDILENPDLDFDVERLIANMVRDGTKLLKAIQS